MLAMEEFFPCKTSEEMTLSALEKCPPGFPYPMSDGTSCCKLPVKESDTSLSAAGDCDGGRLVFTSSPECCMGGMSALCQDQQRGCNTAGEGRNSHSSARVKSWGGREVLKIALLCFYLLTYVLIVQWKSLALLQRRL